MTTVLGIDIGGSGIKGALVDLDKGEIVSDKHRIPTPESRLPDDVLPVVKQVAEHFDYDGPIGIGFPAVVVNGVVKSPFTAHGIIEWVGCDVDKTLTDMIGQPVSMINDADAAGLAEMRYGAGKGVEGIVILITLGTGIGSGMFLNGQLVPNTEFGKLYLKGHQKFAERYAASSIKDDMNLSYLAYAKRLDKYLRYVEELFSPQLFIIGGGISKKHEKYLPLLTNETPTIPAQMRNRAGIVGAAMASLN